MLFHVWVSEDILMSPPNGYSDDNYTALKDKTVRVKTKVLGYQQVFLQYL